MTDDQSRDEQLLQRLGAALVPAATPAVPPPAVLQDLHRAIDASRAAIGVPARRNPRSLTVAIAATIAAACIAVVAVATATPRWSRETATPITVVTTSPALGAVVERQRSLERALADGDPTDVTIASARLRIALANLSSGELGPRRAEIEELLDRAGAFLRGRRSTDGAIPDVSPPDTATAETSTSAPARTVPRGLPPATASTALSGAVTEDDDSTDDPTDDDAETGDDNSGPGNGDDDSGDGSGDDHNRGPGGEGDPGDPGDGVDDDSGSGSD